MTLCGGVSGLCRLDFSEIWSFLQGQGRNSKAEQALQLWSCNNQAQLSNFLCATRHDLLPTL